MPGVPMIRQDLFNISMPAPVYVNSLALAANTAESMEVPDDADLVVLSSNSGLGDYYVNLATTATVPADVTDGTASMANPGIMRVNRGQNFSIISPTGGVITAAFYKRGT